MQCPVLHSNSVVMLHRGLFRQAMVWSTPLQKRQARSKAQRPASGNTRRRQLNRLLAELGDSFLSTDSILLDEFIFFSVSMTIVIVVMKMARQRQIGVARPARQFDRAPHNHRKIVSRLELWKRKEKIFVLIVWREKKTEKGNSIYIFVTVMAEMICKISQLLQL